MGIWKGLRGSHRFTYFKFISLSRMECCLAWSYKEFIQIQMFHCFMLFETWSFVCLGSDMTDRRVDGSKKKHHERCNINWVILITLTKKGSRLSVHLCKFSGLLRSVAQHASFYPFQRMIDLSVPLKKNTNSFSLHANFMVMIRSFESILVVTKHIFLIWSRIL